MHMQLSELSAYSAMPPSLPPCLQIEERRRSQQGLMRELGAEAPKAPSRPPPQAAVAAPPPPPAVAPKPPPTPVPAVKPRTLEFTPGTPPMAQPVGAQQPAALPPMQQHTWVDVPQPLAPAAPQAPEKPPNPNAMNVVFVGAECAPWSKTGAWAGRVAVCCAVCGGDGCGCSWAVLQAPACITETVEPFPCTSPCGSLCGRGGLDDVMQALSKALASPLLPPPPAPNLPAPTPPTLHTLQAAWVM